MNDIDMNKICSGCLMYNQYIEDPKHHHQCEGYIRKHIRCPCQRCLVKTMCDDVCDEYKEAWGFFYNGGYK